MRTRTRRSRSVRLATPAAGAGTDPSRRPRVESLEPRRLLSAGDLDPTFGVGGKVTTDFSNGHGATEETARAAVVVQGDGKLLVAGGVADAGGSNFALVRYDRDGTLDLTFGGGDGKVSTNVAGAADGASAIAVQADGKIVLAGQAGAAFGALDFAVARYNADGTLDAGFGGGDGIVTLDFGGNDAAAGVAIQSDGKIVLAGYAGQASTGSRFAAARFNADGSVDGSFGGNGKVTTAVAGDFNSASGVAVQPDGKIVLAGSATLSGREVFAVVRYNPNGSLDGSFGGGDGVATTGFGNGNGFAEAMALQPDGRIVLAGGGYESGDTSNDFALVRYNADGSPDGSFGGGDGKTLTDFDGRFDVAHAVAVQADGRIVLAGVTEESAAERFAVARYNADGSLDTSFAGGTGRTTTHFDGYQDMAFAVALQSDGRTVVAGGTGFFPPTNFAVARYAADGSLDPAFGDGGKVTTRFGGGGTASIGWDVVPLHNGKILVGGYAGNGYGTDFAVARYNADGTPDASFGGEDGKVATDVAGSSDTGLALAVQGDNKFVVAGEVLGPSGGYDFAVARYNADGSLDAGFGTGGKVISDFGTNEIFQGSGYDFAYAVAVQGDGRIVVGGKAEFYDYDGDFALARYNADGSPDTSFGTGGRVVTRLGDSDDWVQSLVVQPDGKILAAGTGGGKFALARYNADGSLDPTFGDGGKALTDFGGRGSQAFGLVLQNDGKAVVSGVTFPPVGADSRFALARFNGDGSLDQAFGTGGRVTTDFGGGNDVAYALSIQPNGRLVAAGFTVDGTGAYDFALARYEPDGSPDTSFGGGGDGRVSTDFGGRTDAALGVALQADGKILAAGYSDAGSEHLNFALARYEGDAPPPGATPAGSNVVITPAFDGPGPAPAMTVTFGSVTQGGVTTVTTSDTGQGPPSGFRLIGDQTFYELKTTATFTSAEVCIHYDPAAVHNENNLKLFHYEAGVGWVDRTSDLDLDGDVICATVSSFSPFAIFEAVKEVRIDVKPSMINLDSQGVIPVTLFTTADFDARSVDVASVLFADAHAVGSSLADADGDGDLDLLLKFRAQDTSLRRLYSELLVADADADGVIDSTRQVATTTLTGETLSHDLIEGSDTVDLQLSGKALRTLLDQLRAAGLL
jgi:uncharacterized delta-60 repeat protein